MEDGELRREEFVGRIILDVTIPVEAGKVGEFARALDSANPVHYELASALEAGFPAIPAPPTFSAVAAHFSPGRTMSPARAASEALGLDHTRTVNGEQSWEISRLPLVGDVLRAVSRIVSIAEKTGRRGGLLKLVTVSTEITDQRGDAIITETVTVIETTGPGL